MNNKKKVATLLTLLASTTLVIGTVVALQSNSFNNFMTFSEGDTKITLDGTHGNVSGEVQLLKTSNVVSKTFQGNDISFDYKKVEAVSGKVGRLLPGGFYRNRLPLHDMATVRVVSNAATGNAKLYYGKTSAYMTEYVDLQTASTGANISGNFFKIVSDVPVEIESIELSFGCETKDYGAVDFNSSGDPVLAHQFNFVSSPTPHYEIAQTGYNKDTPVITSVPDYYDDETNGQYPVTVLAKHNSDGTFDSFSKLEKIFLPETITTFADNLFWFGSGGNKVKEFTMPLELTSFGSRTLPTPELETLNIHSRNASGSQSYIGSTYTPALKTINISYDVESLPNLINDWPSTMETINYEGTTAEYTAMANAASNPKWLADYFPGDIICSDTSTVDVVFHFENATLDDMSDQVSIKKISGRSINNIGSPIYNDGTKKFVGWFDAASGGNQISFPYVVNSNTDIYAHFEDYDTAQGTSFENAITVLKGQSYQYSTDSVKPVAYFEYTASSDEVLVASITSAATTFTDKKIYFHAYNEDQSEISISTGNSVDSEMSKASRPSQYGVNIPLKISLAANETIYITVDGIESSTITHVGSFTVEFRNALMGEHYSNPFVYTTGEATVSLKTYGVVWYSFTPSVSKSYLYTCTPTAWTGARCGTISGLTFTRITPNDNTLNTSSKLRYVLNLTAGTTYYFGFTANTNGATAKIELSDELDPGMSKSTAILLNVDGDTTTVPYDSTFPDVWYKFNAASAGKFRLVVDNNTSIYTSGSDRPLFAAENESGTALTIGDGRTVHDKVIEVSAAGTYYVKVTTSSSAKNFTFGIETALADVRVKVYPFGPGSTPTTDQVFDIGTEYALPDPVYDSHGHSFFTGFDGWYTDATFTTPFVSGSAINEDTNIYAKSTGKYYSDLFNSLDTTFAGYFSDIRAGSYQWVLDGSSIISTNGRNSTDTFIKGVQSSSSSMVFVAAKPFTVSFDYLVSSESYDHFYVYNTPSGGSRNTEVDARGTSQTASISKSFTVLTGATIEFEYHKDTSSDSGMDMVTITNLQFDAITPAYLTYQFNDGVTADKVIETLPNNAITKITDPTREGYRFDGWYEDDGTFATPFNFSDGISADKTIYAKWVEQVTVTYYKDGPGTSSQSFTMDKGDSATSKLPSINTEIYSFAGWYSDATLETPFDPALPVNSSVTIYAKYTGKYHVKAYNSIDEFYPGIFSTVAAGGNNTGDYHFTFESDSTEGIFTSSNNGVNSSYSEIALTFAEDTEVTLNYTISSEENYDKGSIFYRKGSDAQIDIAYEMSGTDTKNWSGTILAGTTLTFQYHKDSSTSRNDDNFVIRATFVKVSA